MYKEAKTLAEAKRLGACVVDPLNDLKMGYLQVHQNSLLRDEDKNEAEFESHEAVISETGMP